DLPVADFARAVLRAGEDGVDGGLYEFIVAGDVDAHLRQQFRGIFLPAVEVGFLGATAPGAAADRDAVNLIANQRFAHFVELVRLYDSGAGFDGRVPVRPRGLRGRL